MTSERRTVMVIEDDRDVSDALRWVLEDAGYDALTAEHGREALEVLRDATPLPDAILLDLMMPVMDGWQFRAAQLADPAIAGIPVICITAHPDAERTSPELRPAAWLRKPSEMDVLLATIQRVLGAS